MVLLVDTYITGVTILRWPTVGDLECSRALPRIHGGGGNDGEEGGGGGSGSHWQRTAEAQYRYPTFLPTEKENATHESHHRQYGTHIATYPSRSL